MTRAERGRVAPLSAERFHVEFTMTADTKDKLERVLDLMSHANPRRSLATAFDRALDVLLRDLEKKRLGKTSHPRKSRGVKHGNIGHSTLREVYERDGVQCAFVSEAGVRCTSRVFLQTDHVIARALGGSGDAHNARVLCQPHNLFEAEETFGAEHVAHKIEERRKRARSCRVGARARGGEIDDGGKHRRQERLGNERNAGGLHIRQHRQERFDTGPGDPQRARRDDDSTRLDCTTTKVTSDESGNHRRQERSGTGSGNPPRARRGDDSSCSDDGFSRGAECESRAVKHAPYDANAAEVRGKLFAALTTMGFRRGETRDAIGKLERRSELGRVPIDSLLREALALLTR